MHELTLFPPTGSGFCPRVCISNCDKDGSIVSARLASAIDAVSSTRPLKIRINRYTDSTYFIDIANFLARYYRIAYGSRLLSLQTVVLSSVHRAALYIAETLHAPVLPLQLISFSKNIEQACSSPLLSIVGADYGVSDLWQWNKVSDESHIPEEYLSLLKKAENLVVVRSIDTGDDCPIEGRIGNVYVNRTLRRLNPRLWDAISNKLTDKGINYENLRQWEWGLPDITVSVIESVWRRLGKDANHFYVIENGTVELYKMIPVLWEEYLNSNGVQIRGITLNGYWVAHPYYERYAGLVPIHYYKFSMLRETARVYLEKYVTSNIQPGQLCAFTTGAGGHSDPEDVKQFISSYGLQDVFWFSKGFDCPDAECVDVYGQTILKPYEKIMEWISTAPYHLHNWQPLDITSICEIIKRKVF